MCLGEDRCKTRGIKDIQQCRLTLVFECILLKLTKWKVFLYYKKTSDSCIAWYHEIVTKSYHALAILKFLVADIIYIYINSILCHILHMEEVNTESERSDYFGNKISFITWTRTNIRTDWHSIYIYVYIYIYIYIYIYDGTCWVKGIVENSMVTRV